MMLKRKIESKVEYGKVYLTKQEEFISLYPTTYDKTTWYFIGIPIYTSIANQKVTGNEENNKDKQVTGFNKKK